MPSLNDGPVNPLNDPKCSVLKLTDSIAFLTSRYESRQGRPNGFERLEGERNVRQKYIQKVSSVFKQVIFIYVNLKNMFIGM